MLIRTTLSVEENNELIDKVESTCRFSHTSLARGYVPVKTYPRGIIQPYKGRFGEGYVVLEHTSCSTRYCLKSYYIKEVH